MFFELVYFVRQAEKRRSRFWWRVQFANRRSWNVRIYGTGQDYKTFPNCVLVGDILLSLALIAQHVSDRQKQVASEIVSGFAACVLDPVVTCVISEWPVLEFSVAILNDFRADLSAEEIVQERVGVYHRAALRADPLARHEP
jgi:hypothetical protein